MTSVPAAVDGLLSVLRGSSTFARVKVEDGPWVTRPTDPDVAVIGWLPDDGPTVDWSDPIAGLDSDAETYDVQGLMSCWNGDGDIKAARDRADGLIEAFRGLLRDDPTLDGAVSRARLATGAMTQYQTSGGCEVAINFAVRVDVF